MLKNNSIAILDTSSAFISIPSNIHETLVSNWQKQLVNPDLLSCIAGICILQGHCSNFSPILLDIEFRLENKLFRMSPKTYLLDGGVLDIEPKNQCVIGIQSIQKNPTGTEVSDVYILGDVFIRSFYTSLDFEKEVVSLAQNRNLRKHTGISEAKVTLDDKIKSEDDDLIERIDNLEQETFEVVDVFLDVFSLSLSVFRGFHDNGASFEKEIIRINERYAISEWVSVETISLVYEEKDAFMAENDYSKGLTLFKHYL